MLPARQGGEIKQVGGALVPPFALSGVGTNSDRAPVHQIPRQVPGDPDEGFLAEAVVD